MRLAPRPYPARAARAARIGLRRHRNGCGGCYCASFDPPVRMNGRFRPSAGRPQRSEQHAQRPAPSPEQRRAEPPPQHQRRRTPLQIFDAEIGNVLGPDTPPVSRLGGILLEVPPEPLPDPPESRCRRPRPRLRLRSGAVRSPRCLSDGRCPNRRRCAGHGRSASLRPPSGRRPLRRPPGGMGTAPLGPGAGVLAAWRKQASTDSLQRG